MEKGVEEIQTRIKKLHYDSTIFDFHYLYLDAGILFYLISLHCSLTHLWSKMIKIVNSDFIFANPNELIPIHLTVILKDWVIFYHFVTKL